ncbi:hypothetical protein GCM10027422_04430 [Hymenobacter arcticus]
MKTTQLFGAALLGLAISFSAHAQTPVVGTPGAPIAPGSPIVTGSQVPNTGAVVPGQAGMNNGAIVPGQAGMNNGMGTVPAGGVPANATTPIGSSGQLYPAGGVPTRNVDGGTLRSDQPTIGNGNPATTGGQPTRRLNKARTTTAPVRP